MREFLEMKITQIFEDFSEEVDNLESCCILKDLRFNQRNIPDYSNTIIQQLYLLRYFPAYTVEYYRIYGYLQRLNFLTTYNVLSVGAGCGVDFYGLNFSLQPHHRNLINYTGLDRIDWSYRDNLGNTNCRFVNCDINNWTELDQEGYNVIIFPKSIGEFSPSIFHSLNMAISNTNFLEDKICLVSSIREQHDHIDIYRLGQVANTFVQSHNYTCLDNLNQYRHYPNNDSFMSKYPFFKYPDDILYYLTRLLEQCKEFRSNQEPCESRCDCLNRYPILREGRIKFQVIRLERQPA